jgi:hypothetical protein
MAVIKRAKNNGVIMLADAFMPAITITSDAIIIQNFTPNSEIFFVSI